MTYLDSVLDEIRQRGEANREAIAAHRSIQAGLRGAFGSHQRKFEARGIACPKRRVVTFSEPPPLPRSKYLGRPLACTGPKPKGDGYKRDRITGVITRCKMEPA